MNVARKLIVVVVTLAILLGLNQIFEYGFGNFQIGPTNKTDEQIYEYACQETNYEIYHWLSSARAREAKGEVYDPVAADREANGGGGGQEER